MQILQVKKILTLIYSTLKKLIIYFIQSLCSKSPIFLSECKKGRVIIMLYCSKYSINSLFNLDLVSVCRFVDIFIRSLKNYSGSSVLMIAQHISGRTVFIYSSVPPDTSCSLSYIQLSWYKLYYRSKQSKLYPFLYFIYIL